FCARTTTYVNGMWAWWQPVPSGYFDPAEAVRLMADTPDSPKLKPIHKIREGFVRRANTPQKLPLDPRLKNANRLDQLAGFYRMPLSSLMEANKGRDATTPLDDGTEVRISEPEFLPLLAGRFSAEVLSSATLSPKEKLNLLQQLVIPASANLTVLDTVLSRLLVAARPQSAATLDGLEQMSKKYFTKPEPPIPNPNLVA